MIPRSLECTDDQFTETGDNDVEVSYNANGGISTLKRYGRKDDQGIGLVDDLTFTYAKGNQLAYVTDSADPVMSAGAFDFRDNTIETYGLIADRIYDDCGSLLFDTNKGVTMIEYDLLGYPRRVYFSNFGMTEYVYSADGVRLKTRHVTPVPKTKTAPLYSTFTLSPNEIMSVDSTEYYGDFTFEDGAFMRYDFGSGYITPKGTSKLFRYYLKDRLGNIRVVTNRGGTFDQTTHYYPYGATQYSSTGQDLQPYKYNGKELDRMHRLDLYDYGARQYDPVLGQFTQMDPLCEKYYHLNPYMYCAGNPINRIDPNGRDWYQNNGTKYYTWFSSSDVKEGYTYIGDKGSVLGEFEGIIDNVLCGENGLGLESLYSEGFTFDIAPNDKGGLIGSEEHGWDFFDEFVNGTGPEFSVLLGDHPYTESIKNEEFVKQRQNIIKSRGKRGKYTNAGRPQFYPWEAGLNSPMQFIGTYRYDGFSSKDGDYINNVVTDSKSVTSLGYHIPFLKNHRRSHSKAFGTTYQFYIWRSKK